LVYLVLVGYVCTVGGCVIAGGCAGGEGGCVGAMEVCDGGVGKLTCCNVISLWGWTYSCHLFFLLISVLSMADHHYTHPEEAFCLTGSLQLNAGDPTTAMSHIAHDENLPNTGAEQLQKGPTTYVGAHTVFGCQTPLFLVQGWSSMSETALSKVVHLLSFFLSLSVLISETASQDINL
jgi:hypothetical protein